MDEYASFSDEAVSGALEAARRRFEGRDLQAAAQISALDAGELRMLAECISVTVSGNQVCLNLPLGLGNACLPIPFNVPNGTVAQACLSICTTFGIPTGVKVQVIVGGITIVEQTFGKC